LDELTRLLQQAKALLKGLQQGAVEKAVSVVTPKPGELDEIVRSSFEAALPASFTCNVWHEVWQPTRHGLTPSAERDFIQGKSPLLDKIVSGVLRYDSAGGRFRIYRDRVELVRSGDVVVQFR
jgi:hypothetical protein